VPTLLPPDRHAFALHYRLCVMAGCSRRGQQLVSVRLGGQERVVAVCDRHAARRG
jgi:hypothetical protein